MQIGESGKNRTFISGIRQIQERQGIKNDAQMPEKSFHDRLLQNMNTETAAVLQREPECGGIQVKRCERVQTAKETRVRRIPYSECDSIDINVLEGYTLKAKLEPGEAGKDGCSVYVEMKDEEGNMRACLYDAEKLQEGGSVMERIAYEVMRNTLRS